MPEGRIAPAFLFPSILGIFVLALLPTLGVAQSVKTIVPVTSPTDQNQYRYLTLANQLDVLLISDPSSDKAAAALNVAVGSGDDPADREGMAHFLEHMLFLGTEKYPNAGEYQQFIKSHGGSHNAFTAFDSTNYFFDIEPQFLDAALDRFSQQFSAPLFTADLVNRERNAVHSEFSSGIKDDARRYFSVRQALAPENASASQFSVGNLTTLEDSEERPLRKDLINFWKTHYSANLMNLVVYGPQSLEQLQAMVSERFGEIENRQLTAAEHLDPLFRESLLPARVEIQSIKEQRNLTLIFPIPPQEENYHSKPVSYIASLLGHEGEGSLFNTLKAQGWVESLSAGGGIETDAQSSLMVRMDLTPDGLNHQQEIIALVFDMIDRIREQGIAEERFAEMATLAEMDFRFREASGALGESIRLAMAMEDVAPEDVLQAPYLMEEYRPDLYRQILEQLTPENVLVTLITDRPLPETAERTAWYKTPYLITEGAPSIDAPEALEQQLELPAPNPFVPQSLELVSGSSMEKPVLINADGPLPLWYARDTSFDVPRAAAYLSLRLPGVAESLPERLMNRLLVDIISKQVNAWAYPAQLAGLDYRVYTHLRGMTIRVGGYNDRLDELFDKIMATVTEPQITPQGFQLAVDGLRQSLQNSRQDRPVSQAARFVQDAIIENADTTDHELEALAEITLEDLKQYSTRFVNEVDAVMLAHGNLSRVDAITLAATAQSYVFPENSPGTEVARSQVYRLPASLVEARLEAPHPDTGYVLYVQGPSRSLQDRARYRLLAQMISGPFYEQIRTQQQLGYVVYASSYEVLEAPAIGFVVQSPSATPTEIENAVNQFFETYRKTLEAVTEEQLEREKAAVISGLLEQDKTLAQRSSRYWNEIDVGNADFDSDRQLADAVKNVDLKSLADIVESGLLGAEHNLRVIVTNPGKETGGLRSNSDNVIEAIHSRPFVERESESRNSSSEEQPQPEAAAASL